MISKKFLAEVKLYDNTIEGNNRFSKKREIAYDYDVRDVRNTSRMREKLVKIRDFNYADDKHKEEAAKAVEGMEKLMCGNFEITQINAEGLEKSRNTYVLIATDVVATKDLKQYRDDGEGIPIETKTVDSNCPQWNDDRMCNKNLYWRPGQLIRVEWRRNPKCWTDKCIAFFTTSAEDWLGFLRVIQTQAEMRTDDDDFEPRITIKCKEFPDPEKDLKLIERYVIPGTYWTEQ